MKLQFVFRQYHQEALRHFQDQLVGRYELVVQINSGMYHQHISCQEVGQNFKNHGWYKYRIKKL